MSRKERLKTTFSLYFDYLIHGMAIVILAQNMTALGTRWHVGDAGVSYVISSLGIGRLLVLYIAGALSDRFGRRLFVKIGIATYICFFVGIILSHTVVEAYFFGILAGMANSFLDTGTYPALMELYPQKQAAANILIKAFASIGELILPIFVATLEGFNLWFGWSFTFCVVALAINFVVMWHRQFPDMAQEVAPEPEIDTTKSVLTAPEEKSKMTPRKLLLGVVLTIFGYISMATFYLISQWLTQYGETVVKLDMVHARMLVSVYSVGSILGVITTVMLVERVIKPVWFMVGDTLLSFVTLLLMAMFPVGWLMYIGSFVIGCSAASGVMQIGLTIMGNVFPRSKGRITGIYNTAGAIASFSIPVFTGILSKTSVHSIMWFDVGIALIGILCALSVMVILRQKKPDAEGVTEEELI
ncbi:MFS transporter [Secundilactobacillus paracollinoides]|uniref:MFS transporter n=1 Tax=Secundilactobacillus paracollinoides TaxID=240427 RepID=A0A1B2IW17_9LACO|nr:MFS transporter [Secundilactobacillus paracollinoides]ANZ60436.1 MFS transporter [Secundilactobacillus paracollinoides]ANZ65278.1 MFS transporter [Secundilactobacillus paracollinoides]ANZ66264.1 MFS transporter [Secundilactobacillus paracollinoides]